MMDSGIPLKKEAARAQRYAGGEGGDAQQGHRRSQREIAEDDRW